MEKLKLFEQEGTPLKMTRSRILGVLEELGLMYSIQEEDKEAGKFKIVISLPQEHIEEKEDRLRGHVLNEALHTPFDREKILPLVRAIKRSRNLDCEIDTGEKGKYIISVSKK